jgi:hypothetical protein
VPKLSFSQEEILARVEVLDRRHVELEKRMKTVDVTLAEQRALATTVQAALDKLKADVATALDREQRVLDRIDRIGKRVDEMLGVAQGAVR